jgi:hypothetical protein
MIRGSLGALRSLAPFLLAASAVACESEALNPVVPERVEVTQTFAGTLRPNGAETFPFSSQFGLVTATLLNLAPDSSLMVGLSLGTWDGVACAIVLANDKATQGIPVTGTVNASGNLCVRVYDVGTVTELTTYEVRVVHF